MAWPYDNNPPDLVGALNLPPQPDLSPQELGALARRDVYGGLTGQRPATRLGRFGAGIDKVVTHPLFRSLLQGAAAGITGNPATQLPQPKQPSLSDDLNRLRIARLKRADETDAKTEELKGQLSQMLAAGDTEGARGIAAQLYPQLATGELFRAPPVQPKTGIVHVSQAGGMIQDVQANANGTPNYEAKVGVPYARRAGDTINVAGEQPLTAVVGLQNAFNKQSSAFYGIARGLDVAREMKLQGNVQSDINMISAIAKAIDPDSVVRGSEIEMRIDYRNFASQLRSYLQKVNGGGILTPSDRNEMIAALEGELRSRAILQRGVEDQFGAISDQYTVNRKLIIPNTVDDILRRSFPVDKNAPSFAPGDNGLPR